MMDYIVCGPKLDAVNSPCPTVLLAHGAGAAMDSDFMNTIAGLISTPSIRVVRFEFPYMAARRTTGKKAPPPKAEKLMPEYEACVKDIASRTSGPLIIGGKSMGGRIATMIGESCAQQNLISGIICLGYPFHPPKNPQKLRTAHLETLSVPTLICQGERDAFGQREEIEKLTLSTSIDFFWAHDGDHDLKPRKASGATHQQNLSHTAQACAQFINSFLQ